MATSKYHKYYKCYEISEDLYIWLPLKFARFSAAGRDAWLSERGRKGGARDRAAPDRSDE